MTVFVLWLRVNVLVSYRCTLMRLVMIGTALSGLLGVSLESSALKGLSSVLRWSVWASMTLLFRVSCVFRFALVVSAIGVTSRFVLLDCLC